MKLTLVFVFFFCLQSFLPAEAQRISLSGDYTLEKALTQIEKQSGGYTFFYNYELMEKVKPVRINIKNVLLEEALQAVFNNQPFSYSIQNKIIVLRSKTEVADKKEPAAIVVQTLPISGKVNSDDGESLSGAVVTLKRTGKTAVTNERGEFAS